MILPATVLATVAALALAAASVVLPVIGTMGALVVVGIAIAMGGVILAFEDAGIFSLLTGLIEFNSPISRRKELRGAFMQLAGFDARIAGVAVVAALAAGFIALMEGGDAEGLPLAIGVTLLGLIVVLFVVGATVTVAWITQIYWLLRDVEPSRGG